MLYAHGGGMILSNVEIYDGPVARHVSATGVPFPSVEYRYAPEHPAPTPVTDCHAGLRYLAEHAQELGVDPARIAIMGDSGGRGVAASLAIYARDQGGPAIAKQLLIYPMLDDRTVTPDAALVPTATWSYDDNVTGWSALLGNGAGGPDVSPYVAAARLEDFTGLAPAFLEVSELVCREGCDYVDGELRRDPPVPVRARGERGLSDVVVEQHPEHPGGRRAVRVDHPRGRSHRGPSGVAVDLDGPEAEELLGAAVRRDQEALPAPARWA